MIESIYQIGEAVRKEGQGTRAFLESLAVEVPPVKKGSAHIAIFDFNLESGKVKVELREAGRETPQRYLWIGNASGMNDQDRVTTKDLKYLVSQIVPNLLLGARLSDHCPLREKLQQLVDVFYLDIGEAYELGLPMDSGYRRYRRLWDLNRMGKEGPDLEALRELAKQNGDAKALPEVVAQAVIKAFGLDSTVVLFTLSIDGELVVDDPDYQAYLERSYIEDAFEDPLEGVCYLTGKRGQVTTDMTKFKFKYYITDKPGFASGATKKGFMSNLTIGKEAYVSLLVGERFIQRYLGFRLQSIGANGYVIPDVFTNELSNRYARNLLISIQDLKRKVDYDLGLQDRVDLVLSNERSFGSYMVNLLFYKQSKENFKVLRLIQDVPEYRLQEIRRALDDISELFPELYGFRYGLTLSNLGWLLPVRKSGTDLLVKSVLDFYSSIIEGGVLERRELVEAFLELVRVYMFGNPNYQVSIPKDDERDWTVLRYLAQTNVLLAFLRSMGQLKEEEMDQGYLQDLMLLDEQREYLSRLRYTPQQTALYLLGTIMADIAREQATMGGENGSGEKVILNKLNYEGMTLQRVQRLAVELFDKMRQYKVLTPWNEQAFAQAQGLLSEYASRWNLTPAENVYYILSGYSHSTLQAMKHARSRSREGAQAITTLNGE
ncbi:CRISPR-associated protein, Csh1 family [Thermobaculum terrenum ATCC BAA-798]|uniref:CRISPR-associated protein, Csh1 family n=1 Tax=Thermobaculum terrenum (strain ATCC BAA-798 / CCMEE 7001 / YNP1) TaxID=525904 RepID=D1CHU9_THET1|nr:TIGR02556 family CRISPR-associated protein [Thermobaculum terrenum]ACZ43320.1 CRISPR-associated protein, Csh1 family [Thermobaculum terrenum ATCC BAA-798]